MFFPKISVLLLTINYKDMVPSLIMRILLFYCLLMIIIKSITYSGHSQDSEVDPQEGLTHCWVLDKLHVSTSEILNILFTSIHVRTHNCVEVLIIVFSPVFFFLPFPSSMPFFCFSYQFLVSHFVL